MPILHTFRPAADLRRLALFNSATTLAGWFDGAAGWLAPAAAAATLVAGLALLAFGERLFKPAILLVAGLFGAAAGLVGAPILTAPATAAPGTLLFGSLLGLGFGMGLCWLAYRWLLAMWMGAAFAAAGAALTIGLLSLPGPRAALARGDKPDASASRDESHVRVHSGQAGDDPQDLSQPPGTLASESFVHRSGDLVIHAPPPSPGEPIGSWRTPRHTPDAAPDGAPSPLGDPDAITQAALQLGSLPGLGDAAHSAAGQRLSESWTQVQSARSALDKLPGTADLAGVLPRISGMMTSDGAGHGADDPAACAIQAVRKYALGLTAREQGVLILSVTIGWALGMLVGFRCSRFSGRLLSSAAGAAIALTGFVGASAAMHVPWLEALRTLTPSNAACGWLIVSLIGCFVQATVTRRKPASAPA